MIFGSSAILSSYHTHNISLDRKANFQPTFSSFGFELLIAKSLQIWTSVSFDVLVLVTFIEDWILFDHSLWQLKWQLTSLLVKQWGWRSSLIASKTRGRSGMLWRWWGRGARRRMTQDDWDVWWWWFLVGWGSRCSRRWAWSRCPCWAAGSRSFRTPCPYSPRGYRRAETWAAGSIRQHNTTGCYSKTWPDQHSYNLICRSPSSPPPAPCRDPSGCSSCRGGGGRRGPGRSGSRSCKSSFCVLPQSWSHPARGSRCTGSRPSHSRARHSHCRRCRPWRGPSSPSAGSDFETLGWYCS